MRESKAVRPDAVAVYIRWSTDEQGEGTTLDVQRERCSLYVRSQGWNVREDLLYVDEGCSGASLERPGLARLRAAVAAGQVDCVVTYKLDRLSRNLADTVMLVRHEWKGKCIYRSATEGFDSSQDSPTGGLIFNVLASFAEFERAVIRDRTRAGTLRRMQEGMYISGTVPFGYRRAGKGKLAVRPGEAETVRRIFAMAAAGAFGSAAAIARALNAGGIPGPGGGCWWSSTVSGILGNPLYMGTVAYGRRRSGSAVAVAGAAPAIVDADLFGRAAGALGRRQATGLHHRNRAGSHYLLTTIASCLCGGPLGAVRDRHRHVYYRCQRPQQGVACAAGASAFRAEPVEGALVAALCARYGGAVRKRAQQLLATLAASDARPLELERARKTTERRRSEVAADLSRLRRQVRRGQLQPATYEELKADAAAELAELTARLERLQAANRGPAPPVQVPSVGSDLWDSLTPAERKEVLRAFCTGLTVHRPKGSACVAVAVDWAGPDAEAPRTDMVCPEGGARTASGQLMQVQLCERGQAEPDRHDQAIHGWAMLLVQRLRQISEPAP